MSVKQTVFQRPQAAALVGRREAIGFTLDDYLCFGGYPGAARWPLADGLSHMPEPVA